VIVRRKSGWQSSLGLGLGLVTAITMAIGLYLGLVWAPEDAIQGNAQRIFYIHVPMAWVAFLAFGVVFLAAILPLEALANLGSDCSLVG